MTRRYGNRLFVVAALAGILGACADQAVTGVDDAEFKKSPGFAQGPNSVTVMSRNIYVGTNVDRVIEAETPEQIPLLVAEAFQTLLETNFPERAGALADEIAEARPHLLGLQEISIIRRQSPGDAIVGGTIPAEEILFDYLAILLDALDARGLDYRVAASIQNADVEVPMLTGFAPLSFDDIRLTDFDVILARGDVAISNITERNYEAKLMVPIGDAVVLDIPRGFTAVNATIGQRTYRFANTHLEPAVLGIQQAQAAELIAELGRETLPVILVGDLNTPAPFGDTYNDFLDAFYADAWTKRVNGRDESGFTANLGEDLRSETVILDQRSGSTSFSSATCPAKRTGRRSVPCLPSCWVTNSRIARRQACGRRTTRAWWRA